MQSHIAPAATPAAQPEAAGFSAARLARITDFLQVDVAAGSIPGAVAWIARKGRLAYFEAIGFADRHSKRTIQRDSIFRIASMTKPITTVAAMLLQERGELLLGDPLSRYIPGLKSLQVGIETVDAMGERRLRLEPARRPITIQDLMRHTAGFTYGDFGDSLVQREYRRVKALDMQATNAQMAERLAGLPLACHPGSTFEYGMSTDVLGRVVEIVADMSLDAYFAKFITEPLGMIDTAFVVPGAAADRIAKPQRSPNAPPKANVSTPPMAPRWFSGGGGLSSTAEDYSHFCQMMLNGGEWAGTRILSRKSVELMTRNHLPPGIAFGSRTDELGQGAPLPEFGQGYGLGFGVRLQDGLATVPGSRGDYYWSGITGPTFWIDPQEELIVVFMMQEMDMERRARYRSVLRALVYQALE